VLPALDKFDGVSPGGALGMAVPMLLAVLVGVDAEGGLVVAPVEGAGAPGAVPIAAQLGARFFGDLDQVRFND